MLASLIFTVCAAENKNFNKQLEVILTTEAVLQDPIQCKGYQQFQVINLFLDTLVRKKPSIGIVNGIASHWEVSKDQKEYTFHLSNNAFFHNEEPIQSEDVVFSFNRHLEQDSPSLIAIYLKNVLDRITIIDKKTVKFTLKGAYSPFLELIAMPGFGIINHKSTKLNIIGSGPYMFIKNENNKTCLKKLKSYKSEVNNIDTFCFRIERDIKKTINLLNNNEVDLAMGSPLEVALSKELKNDLIDNPTFSLVTTHVFLNHSNNFFLKKKNRQLIRDILYDTRNNKDILTKFDLSLDTFLPRGVMNESYYKKQPTTNLPNNKDKKPHLKVVFPYGIFLETTVHKIVDALKVSGFDVSFINVKGKELLEPILKGEFDLLFVPYQGTIADPDGYLDLLNPESVFSKAQIPTRQLLEELKEARFIPKRVERSKKYETILHNFEKELHIIPFSQNSIPIVYNKKIVLPDLNFSFHLNLRELRFRNE